MELSISRRAFGITELGLDPVEREQNPKRRPSEIEVLLHGGATLSTHRASALLRELVESVLAHAIDPNALSFRCLTKLDIDSPRPGVVSGPILTR